MPSTSTIAPSAYTPSDGKRTRSSVTLSPALASLACGSRTMMGSPRNALPSGCTIHRLPSCTNVPVKRVRPRSITSITRPVIPESLAPPRTGGVHPRCLRLTEQRTRSPLMASPRFPAGRNKSPSRVMRSGRTKPWPFCVTNKRPQISSSWVGRRSRPLASSSMRPSSVSKVTAL